jgi:type IV pilus assembly protein PilA
MAQTGEHAARQVRYVEYFGSEAAAARHVRKFARFEQGGSPLSWNWAACFFTLGWLLYRRIPLAWLYLPVSVPVVLFFALAARANACETALREPSAVGPIALGIYGAVVFLAVPAFADRLHFAFVRRRLARAAPGDRLDAPGARRMRGAFAALLTAVLGLGAVVGSASFADYSVRAKVSEALQVIAPLKTPVAEHWADKGKPPASFAELGVDPTSPLGTAALGADASLTFTFSWPRLAGRRVALTTADQGRNWSCASPDIPGACLPRACR